MNRDVFDKFNEGDILYVTITKGKDKVWDFIEFVDISYEREKKDWYMFFRYISPGPLNNINGLYQVSNIDSIKVPDASEIIFFKLEDEDFEIKRTS